MRLHQWASEARRALERKGGLTVTDWGLMALNVVVAAMTTVVLALGWRAELGDAERNVQSTTKLLERSVGQTLDKIAIALDGAAEQLEAQLQDGGLRKDVLWPLLDRAALRVPEVQSMVLFDEAGRQVCGEAPAGRCKFLDVSDRGYFIDAHLKVAGEHLIAGPITSRLDGAPILVIARPVRLANGEFKGILAALVPVARIQDLLRVTRANEASASSLRGLDLRLLVREPALSQETEVRPVSETLRELVRREPLSGVFRAETGSDGVDRISGYQLVQGWPIYVLAGSAVVEVLAHWRTLVLIAIGFVIAFILGSVALATAWHRRDAALQRMHELMNTAPCGYHTLDTTGKFVSINATELEWLGGQESDYLGKKSPRDFFTDASRRIFDENFPKLKSEGQLSGLELEMIDQAGATRQVLVSAKAVYDEQGHFIGSNSVMQDLTAQRRAEGRIRELVQSQSAMLDNDLIGIARLRGREIVWANRGMSRLLGYSAEEFVGMPMRQLYLDERTYRWIGDESYPLLRSGGFHRVEVQMRRKDGTAIWMDAGGAPLAPNAEEVLMMLADISDKKAAETMRLRAVELQAKNAQLIETNRLHDEFLANMSHELRTPLNGILGMGQVLGMAVESQDKDRLRLYVDQILASGKHLLSLVEAQLDYALSVAGQLKLSVEPFDKAELVRESINVYAQQASARNVTINFEDQSVRAQATGDVGRIRQVVGLLLDNALKFGAMSGVVTVRLSESRDETWQIEVVDDGPGIAAEDHEKIFRKFTQLSSGNMKRFGGAGMGLALVRQLAIAMGGDVAVQSAIGLGSVFVVTLPGQGRSEDRLPIS